MADAIVSAAAERLISLIDEQARHHINLVRGAEEKVQKLAEDLQKIRNVLEDAESRRFKDNNINYWLSRLEHTASEMEDILDEWDYALLKYQIEERRSEADHHANLASSKQKVCSFIPSSSCFSCNKVVVRHNIGKKILSVKAKLDEILKERNQYGFVISQPVNDPSPTSWRESTSMIDLTEVHGRDRDRDDLVTKLMDSGGIQGESGCRILSIVGVGGLGKTTLAQMVYNHSRVVESFELRIWVCVSDPFDLVAIGKGILDNIKVGSSPDTNNLEVVFKQVKESISGKIFFLVLDDVWSEDSHQWEILKNSLGCGGAGSKILVTSRNEMVVKKMGSRESEICRLGLLSDEDCWLLLRRIALSERNTLLEFEDIGKKIAKKCKGLPLAAKTLGSLLRFKSNADQWSNILNSEIWQMEKAEIEIFPHLLLSYNGLSPTLKRCFSYCAVFPKDTEIEVESLIRKWMALGYLGPNVGDMELRGRECFDALAMRSLFQDFGIGDSNQILSCMMHDIVHDFAQFLKKRSKVEAQGIKKVCGVCNPSLISRVSEFCTLLCEGETLPSTCDCLVHLRVFDFRGCKSVPHGMGSLIHLRWLNMDNTDKLSGEDFKAIFQLYHLQSLILSSCSIEEVPKEIENLIQLRLLDLSDNSLKELPREIGNLIQLRLLELSGNSLKELPREIGNLVHLKDLNISCNRSLEELPESMCELQELQTLQSFSCYSLCKIPKRLVHKLGEFSVGIGGIKLELLKKLKSFSGELTLRIRLNGDGDLNEVVDDYRKAELRNEIGITRFIIYFTKEELPLSSSWVWMEVMDALEPHPNLSELTIYNYGGSKLPLWMGSPLNQLRNLTLAYCNNLTSLPHLEKLPCLESVFLFCIKALEIVGREFLGITREECGDVVAFPKLKWLEILDCNNWKEWEDITVEEEESTASSIMPCLTELRIRGCKELPKLPHRLLRKMSSLETLAIGGSTQLKQRYGDKDGSDWKSISINNPGLQLIVDDYPSEEESGDVSDQ